MRGWIDDRPQFWIGLGVQQEEKQGMRAVRTVAVSARLLRRPVRHAHLNVHHVKHRIIQHKKSRWKVEGRVETETAIFNTSHDHV